MPNKEKGHQSVLINKIPAPTTVPHTIGSPGTTKKGK